MIVASLVLVVTSLFLFAFGANLLYLSWRSLRIKRAPLSEVELGAEPRVCVQVPVYDERYVAERVIDAVCGLEWPRSCLEIQVLDDSDDDTVAIVSRAVARWRRRGIEIAHVRRGTRLGYKAGALAHGLALTTAPFVAIFDADFVPPREFLRRMMAAFDDPRVGFAQARWGHLNEGYSLLTRLQALIIDFHFLVEQAARSANGCFTNFTGSAGVWRRTAIEDAGGWSALTMTEDLDLSYRAQLRGWKPSYRELLEVPEELPVAVDAYRRQQARWATGSFQSALRLLGPVLRSRVPLGAKWQACVHLLSYGFGPLMLVQLACYPPILWALAHGQPLFGLGELGLGLNLMSLVPWAGFVVAEVRRGRGWWHGLPAVGCQVLGAGMSLTVMMAMLSAFRPGGEFVRTPKFQIIGPGQEWRDAAYVRVLHPVAVAELALGLGTAAMALIAVRLGAWLIAVYSTLFAAGLLSLSLFSLWQALQVVTRRRFGRRPPGRLRSALPAALALALPASLVASALLLPLGFEDSYQHWLVAANLASTGRLADPLFAMEDTWLPAYHVLAAGVLALAGLWQLGALKALSAGLGLATLAITYQLAGGGRRGRLAVVLLGLNPIFLLTATEAVAEPLLTALLLGATAAALAGRFRLAAVLAVIACLTGTKAWLWLAAVLVVMAAERLAARRTAPRRAIAWALPALLVLAAAQLAFAPATHSLARAAVEAGSATARGSLPGGPLARGGQFVGYFALATLPLVALAPLGVLRELKTAAGRANLRLLHLPALLYLAAVVALVGAGFYSGSHRYYYLALPALAVLAAAALERARAPLTVAAAAAAALLTVGYLPTLVSFGAGNDGLLAAGRAAAAVPGRLLTDSPAAAYASGKAPRDVLGSRGLPGGRSEAVAWLQRRGVTSLVVEDIDYYRAVAVFPDLAVGRPQPPFRPLGEEARYQVPGGKTAYAYRLGAPAWRAELGDGISVSALAPPPTGKTAPLAKGLVLERNGQAVTGEGMGFGVPIVRYPDGWFFAGTVTTEPAFRAEVGQSVIGWRKSFALDRADRGFDAAGHFLGFEAVPSRGSVEVTYYAISNHEIRVEVRVRDLQPGWLQLAVLNEQSGNYFDDYADSAQTLLGPAIPRWSPVEGDWARFRSQMLGAEWSLPRPPEPAAFTFGREVELPVLDWSGLEYSFGADFSGLAYTITVQKAR